MTAMHYVQWTTALDPRRCDYSIEKAFSNRQTGSTVVHFNIFLQCFDMLAILKNCYFQALLHLNSPYFFHCCSMWCWSLTASQADIYRIRNCSDMKAHQKTTCIQDDHCCCCFQHYWSRDLTICFSSR